MTDPERQVPKMPTEIERKFLVDPAQLDSMELDSYPHEEIRQGYLSYTSEAAIRVREKGGKYFITYKGAPADNPAERVELEADIDAKAFEKLWPATAGRRVEKTRYRLPYPGRVIELDVFHGDNEGHVLAEVEFYDLSAADDFLPPAWFGADVTADKAYGNASIATHGWPEEV